eukprot:gene34167-42127_t
MRSSEDSQQFGSCAAGCNGFVTRGKLADNLGIHGERLLELIANETTSNVLVDLAKQATVVAKVTFESSERKAKVVELKTQLIVAELSNSQLEAENCAQREQLLEQQSLFEEMQTQIKSLQSQVRRVKKRKLVLSLTEESESAVDDELSTVIEIPTVSSSTVTADILPSAEATPPTKAKKSLTDINLVSPSAVEEQGVILEDIAESQPVDEQDQAHQASRESRDGITNVASWLELPFSPPITGELSVAFEEVTSPV